MKIYILYCFSNSKSTEKNLVTISYVLRSWTGLIPTSVKCEVKRLQMKIHLTKIDWSDAYKHIYKSEVSYQIISPAQFYENV